MTIQLDGTVVATTMRTPGHDFELAVGFCHTEGLLRTAAGDATPVSGVRYCGTGSAVETEFNVVTVETGGRAVAPTPRLGATSSSCGWCGSDQLDAMTDRLAPFDDPTPIPLDVVRAVPDGVLAAQGLFDRTGAVHAAAVFDPAGTVDLVREDVGRHNAVDAIAGFMWLDGIDGSDKVFYTTGRLTSEMVIKCAQMRIPFLVSRSGLTEMGYAIAKKVNLTMLGRASGRHYLAFTGRERLLRTLPRPTALA